MKKLLFGVIVMAFTVLGYAEPSQSKSDSSSDHALVFSVVQDDFVLDTQTIKSASMIEKPEGRFGGLHIELKPKAAEQFAEITKAGVGRKLILVFNKVVVTTAVLQSPISGNFVVSGISREDAQTFMNVLKATKPKGEDDAS